MSIRIMPGSRVAVAIGSFDGVHLGHQHVVGTMLDSARKDGLVPIALTFEPLPREYFMGAAAPSRLQSLQDRTRCLMELGLTRVECLEFDATLANEPAERFVQRVLVEALGTALVVVGEDFRFGHERSGNFELLRRLGEEAGFLAVSAPILDRDGERVSSTRIRSALQSGRMDEAAALLGRRFGLTAAVVHGEARGRELGFPTANLRIERPPPLADGVYAVTVGTVDGRRYGGAAHWGQRAWLGGTERRLEIHLLDFEGDLYGQMLEVEFVAFIRPDQEFDGLPALRRQIEEDIGAIRGRL